MIKEIFAFIIVFVILKFGYSFIKSMPKKEVKDYLDFAFLTVALLLFFVLLF